MSIVIKNCTVTGLKLITIHIHPIWPWPPILSFRKAVTHWILLSLNGKILLLLCILCDLLSFPFETNGILAAFYIPFQQVNSNCALKCAEVCSLQRMCNLFSTQKINKTLFDSHTTKFGMELNKYWKCVFRIQT